MHCGPRCIPVYPVVNACADNDVEGMSPMPGKFKSGDIKWLPGDYTHTVTNLGKSPQGK